jgi:hypothetical protein
MDWVEVILQGVCNPSQHLGLPDLANLRSVCKRLRGLDGQRMAEARALREALDETAMTSILAMHRLQEAVEAEYLAVCQAAYPELAEEPFPLLERMRALVSAPRAY